MILRISFVFICVLGGLSVGWNWEHHNDWELVLSWGLGGAALGLSALGLEKLSYQYSTALLLGMGVGLVMGLLGAALLTWILFQIFPSSSVLPLALALTSLVFFSYYFFLTGIRVVQEGLWPHPISAASQDTDKGPGKLLDTSSIIDGRIVDLCVTGFLEGPLTIPQFILHELQFIADAPHSLKRIRGKRGLGVLNHLKKIPGLEVEIIDEDIPKILEVDSKLVELAKKSSRKIVTNDWNLAQLASAQGIQTLNVNELSYHLRPLVLPGETIRVLINKEGQSSGQGIAHLDDGTLVVVDGGHQLIGRTVDVMVTKYIQTNTGRMIFTCLQEKKLDSTVIMTSNGGT